MNKYISAFISVVALSITAQSGRGEDIVVITFSEPGLIPGAPGTPVTDQFVSLGVRFSVLDNGIGLPGDFPDINGVTTTAIAGGLAGPSGDPVLGFNTSPPLTSPPGILIATFTDPSGSGLPATVPASSFSVFVSDTNATPPDRVIVRTFGLDGSLLEERILMALGATLSFSAGEIARVEFIDNGSDGFTIDDFTFGRVTATVPEPDSLLLAGVGILGLAGYRWRRRKQSGVTGGAA